jgi:hypothetical protein
MEAKCKGGTGRNSPLREREFASDDVVGVRKLALEITPC